MKISQKMEGQHKGVDMKLGWNELNMKVEGQVEWKKHAQYSTKVEQFREHI